MNNTHSGGYMRFFSVLVAILVGSALVAGPALAQTPGTFGTSSSPTMVSPGVTSSMTGGIPGTLGGTSNPAGSSITGGIPGTLGGTQFNSGGSTTGAIGSPSTQGTTTTGPTNLLGGSVFGGSTGAAR
jgi:hypothetical protein